MSESIDKLMIQFSNLHIDHKFYSSYSSYYLANITKIIKLQAFFRGCIYRKNHLPNSILNIQNLLKNANLKLNTDLSDGRTNSCIDEDIIIEFLITKLDKRIVKPVDRYWWDCKVFDFKYGWLPINIKSTTTTTSDNTGNLAICVYALTNYPLNLDMSYQNGFLSNIFIQKIKEKGFNKIFKKDYYFIVVNKTNTKEVIANSVKGLTTLTSNINNLPFQVKWSNNKTFIYQHIKTIFNKVILAIQKPKPSWKENFLTQIRQESL